MLFKDDFLFALKVGGLGDVLTGLSKALQKKGHLVEIILPKYDCMQYERIRDLRVCSSFKNLVITLKRTLDSLKFISHPVACAVQVLDLVVESYFDGRLFKNKIWVGTVEGWGVESVSISRCIEYLVFPLIIILLFPGLPVYFIEPHHPGNLFWRGQLYGENDDFKRFSFFSRAALELIFQACKKPDIIHCHDWQTAFVV